MDGKGEWLQRVYPRVGGGTRISLCPFRRIPGSIPAWAGEPSAIPYADGTAQRSIPAWAGEPFAGTGIHAIAGVGMHGRRVYPRVGGGTCHSW